MVAESQRKPVSCRHAALLKVNRRMLPKLVLAALLLWTPALCAQTPAPDTTIAGQSLRLLPIETLIAELQRPADGPPVIHRQVAFSGRLFAPTSGIDTLRVPLDFEDVYFLDEVSFSQVAFLAPVRFARTHFAGGLSCAQARFTATFSLCASHIAKHATFQKTRFLGDSDLGASRFAGVASFVGAHFAGQHALFAQTQFDKAAYFEQAAFAAPATFTDAAFAGIASFKETAWAQPLSFAGVRFADRALFWDVHFAAEASFNSGRADGEVAFDRARFSGEASFADFTFARAAHFRGATFGQARFDRAYFRQEADFSESEGRVIRLGAFFNRSLDLSRAAFALIDLRPAGADSTFATNSLLYLHQPRFGRIQVRWPQLAGHLAATDAPLDPTYAALYHQFLAQGLHGDAAACRAERMDRRRLSRAWNEPVRWGLELWRLSSDYGTAPQRVIAFMLAVILFFGLAYRTAPKAMRPASGEGRPTLADCIVFSIYTFIHVNHRAWDATGKLKLLAVAEALLGWVFFGLLMAVALAHLP